MNDSLANDAMPRYSRAEVWSIATTVPALFFSLHFVTQYFGQPENMEKILNDFGLTLGWESAFCFWLGSVGIALAAAVSSVAVILIVWLCPNPSVKLTAAILYLLFTFAMTSICYRGLFAPLTNLMQTLTR